MRLGFPERLLASGFFLRQKVCGWFSTQNSSKCTSRDDSRLWIYTYIVESFGFFSVVRPNWIFTVVLLGTLLLFLFQWT